MHIVQYVRNLGCVERSRVYEHLCDSLGATNASKHSLVSIHSWFLRLHSENAL